jgi:hypothetical protein
MRSGAARKNPQNNRQNDRQSAVANIGRCGYNHQQIMPKPKPRWDPQVGCMIQVPRHINLTVLSL